MDIIEALRRLKEISDLRLRDFQRVYDSASEIVEKAREKGIEIGKIGEVKKEPLLSIDSSCKMLSKDSFGRNVYAIVVAGVGYKPSLGLEYKYFTVNQGIIKGSSVELFYESVDFESYLSTFGLCMEMLYASKEIDKYFILMDGSVITFAMKFNEAYALSNRHLDSGLSKWFIDNYSEIYNALSTLISSQRVVFIPKASSRTELLEVLGMEDSGFTDFEVVKALLKEDKEYIVLPIKEFNYYGSNLKEFVERYRI